VTTRNKTPLVVAVVLAVVAIAAIVAVVAARGDEPDTTDGGSSTTTPLPDDLVGEFRPVVVEGSVLPPLENPNDDPAVGLAAPVLVGESFDGSAVTTASEDGPALVVIFAHWCPHCNNEIPRLLALEDAGRFPDDLKIVGVNTGVRADRPNFPPSEWIVERGWPWPVIADDVDFSGAEAFGVTAFPFMTVVDADGTVRARWTGESAPDDFMAKLDTALAG
jgi:thiol-disulfide isomerase/thioredoxin